MERQEFEMMLLKLRDFLYHEWLDTIEYQVPNGYHEWEGKDVVGESLSVFQQRGSKKFALIELMLKRFNSKPSKRNPARLFAYDFLDARTPFSSIMTATSFELIERIEGRQAIDSFYENLKNPRSHQNLWSLALESSEQNHERALSILSTVAAQRIYLIRDYKVWMENNLDSLEYDLQMQSLKLGSQAYFNIETAAFSMPLSWNYPNDVLGNSAKSYHFYTTAMLSYQLAKQGYDKETCIKEATRAGKNYKRGIQIPGLVHNIWLKNKLNAGTVGDYRQVIHEQILGAEWGFSLANK
tara:strand:+ start:3979 stop:4869 length:891 start_codon:yes stop_codon:yes gene_type:complete